MITLTGIESKSLNPTAVSARSTQVTELKNEGPAAQSSSSVVALNGQLEEGGKSSGVKLDKASAAAFAADIAGLFSGKGMGVQANLNGFDAARLLA